jgi:hypothetical protein
MIEGVASFLHVMGYKHKVFGLLFLLQFGVGREKLEWRIF